MVSEKMNKNREKGKSVKNFIRRVIKQKMVIGCVGIGVGLYQKGGKGH